MLTMQTNMKIIYGVCVCVYVYITSSVLNLSLSQLSSSYYFDLTLPFCKP